MKESQLEPSNSGVEDLSGIDVRQVEQGSDKKKKTGTQRKLTGPLKIAITIATVIMSAYHLYTAVVVINPFQQRAIHLLFVMALVFLLYPARSNSPSNRPSAVDWALAAVTLSIFIYLLHRFPELARLGGRGNTLDLACGVIIILLVLEIARRTAGIILPCMAIFMIGYGFLGYLVPGPLHHSGFTWIRIVRHLTLTTEGIFGQILGVSATFIFLFILFGAFLSVTGVAAVFNDIALAMVGSKRGGPAKVSVVASALVGSVTGSASANVATTGPLTIPLMVKIGYKPYFASAVEAAASTGGQIMPPVMGAAAFLIADSLAIPYLNVVQAALIPSILYFVCVWCIVDLRAGKEKLSGLNKADLPMLKEVLIRRGYLLIPLFGMIYLLLIGYRATEAAIAGIVLSILVSFVNKDTRIKPIALINAMESGALNALPVAAVCAVIGIIVGIISLTGSVLAIGAAILRMSGGILWLTLFLTMLTATLLGLGMPTTACYIITSTIAAPALVQLGVPPLAAHMFVFYYGILSAITPPVASCAYTAAGLSGSNPNRVSVEAVRLAIAGWIIPFMFIYNPELLLQDGLSLLLVRSIATSIIGVYCLGWAVEGYCYRRLNPLERLACVAAAILLIDSRWMTDIIGLTLAGFFFLTQKAYERKHNNTALV